MRVEPLALAILVATAHPASARLDPGRRCEAAKLRATGGAAADLLACYARAARKGDPVDGGCRAPARARLAGAFAAAEGTGGCGTVGDVMAVESALGAFIEDAAAELRPASAASRCIAGKLRATGRDALALLDANAEDAARTGVSRFGREAARAATTVSRAFERLEARSRCQTAGDAGAIAAKVDAFVDQTASRLGPPLRRLAERVGRRIGTAVRADALAGDREYAETLAREFDFVTPENEMKWGPTEPSPGVWNFGPADRIVAFAEAHGMRVKGHNLVWHFQLPTWVNAGMTPAELESAMEDHIATLVGRYRGRVAVWDVVNEAVGFDGALANTIFLQKLGPGYIATAFRLAHQADPHAVLVYNDYLADGVNPKSDGIYALVQSLLGQGVPVHGVGLQMHLGGLFGLPPPTVRQNMQRFADLGLSVYVSEMDVQTRSFPGDHVAKLAMQRAIYHEVVGDCVAVSRCAAVTFWEFTDKYTWIDAFFGPDEPLPFDAAFRPKPADFGVRDALLGN